MKFTDRQVRRDIKQDSNNHEQLAMVPQLLPHKQKCAGPKTWYVKEMQTLGGMQCINSESCPNSMTSCNEDQSSDNRVKTFSLPKKCTFLTR